MTERVLAWHVEIYWYSTIHRIGWFRAPNNEGDKVFRRKWEAEVYAKHMTGMPSILVSYMMRKGVVVETDRPLDWRDRLRAKLNQKPFWLE